MKKNKQYRANKQVVRNSKRSTNTVKRNYPRVVTPDGKYVKMHCPSETTRAFEIGPSLVTEVKNGKTVKWNSWSSNNKQQPTEVAKATIEANKSAKQSKKTLIKNILMKAGYDPTIRYTRNEKKKFTRIVKNNMFTKPNYTPLTTEQIKEKIKAQRLANQTMKKKFDEQVRNNPLPVVPGKQRGTTAAELSVKEKPKKRKFTYVIQRYKDAKPNATDIEKQRTYDFATDYFDASTREEAFKIVAKKAKAWEKDSSFSGISVRDKEGDNSITYYSRNKLFAA